MLKATALQYCVRTFCTVSVVMACTVAVIDIIHSFRCLSYDMSVASSKASFPQSASRASSFSFKYSGRFLRVIQCLPTSCSLPSRHFCHSCFSISNVKNPISLPSFYCMYDIPLLLHFLISHTIGATDLLHPSPARRSSVIHCCATNYDIKQNENGLVY